MLMVVTKLAPAPIVGRGEAGALGLESIMTLFLLTVLVLGVLLLLL
jgi:hypothetical protein